MGWTDLVSRKCLALIAAVLIGAGSPALAESPAEGKSSASAENDDAPAEGSEGATGIYVTLDPLMVPVIDNGVVRQHLSLQLQLEMNDLQSDRLLHKRYHRLVDAFFSELYSLLSMRYVRERGLDVEFFRKRLKLRADRVLGKGAVRDVLVRDVQERTPMRND